MYKEETQRWVVILKREAEGEWSRDLNAPAGRHVQNYQAGEENMKD